MSVSKEFILAGDATFTIECPPEAKHPHCTFQVQHKDADDRWPESWFVRVLTGPDNTSDYVYAGKLDPFTGQLRLTAKSAFPADSFRVRLFNRVLARVWTGDHAAYEQHGYVTHHEGRCGRCGRKLTVPSSVAEGIGPECREIMGLPPLPKPAKVAKPKRGRKAKVLQSKAGMHSRVAEKAEFAEMERKAEEAAFVAKMQRDEGLNLHDAQLVADRNRLMLRVGETISGPAGGTMGHNGFYTGD